MVLQVKRLKQTFLDQKQHIEEGYKSVSLNIVYESKEKTLKVDDINEPHNKIMNELNKAYNANLRG